MFLNGYTSTTFNQLISSCVQVFFSCSLVDMVIISAQKLQLNLKTNLKFVVVWLLDMVRMVDMASSNNVN